MLVEMNKVKPGLYIGNLQAASNKAALEREGITHVLNAAADITWMFPDQFLYKWLELQDHPSQDIAQYFEESNEFIDAARDLGGKVLVHCRMGVSRSATLVIAYLISRFGMSAEKARMHLVKKHKQVSPNTGFVQQLQTYSDEIYGNETGEITPISSIYTWKRCRAEIFRTADFAEHISKAYNFSYKKSKRTDQAKNYCSSYFLEQAEWMGDLWELEGLLYWTKCEAKLGVYKWAGKQCSCGCWVAPAFQIHGGSVDAMPDRPLESVITIATPVNN